MDLIKHILDLGAYKAGEVNCADISLNAEFRKACESNACGYYGRCHTCPPDAGDIYDLMDSLKQYKKAIIFQTVSELEDSYDIEGMTEASIRHNQMASKISDILTNEYDRSEWLHLGAGGCRVCEVCTKRENLPCRYPEKAMYSLETYGIDVSQLAPLANMNYINGQDTVTYFGAIFFK